MGSHSNGSEESSAEMKIEFKNLESLLQQCFDKRDLQVVDYSATKMLPAGENFGSIMLKINAKIRANDSAKEETLHLVGKTPPCLEKRMVEWPLIFQKELFMYAELFPLYRELEKEAGIDERDLINILPSFIGYRNSLKDDAEADDDSVLLMENLKFQGYYVVNKHTGLDVHHARKALESLARYHALGIVMKQKRLPFAKKAIEMAKVSGIDFLLLDNGYAGVREVLLKAPHLKKHLASIESSFEHAKDGGNWLERPTEPWATITHGDFWTNNMLFHKDDEGNVDDVKFIDFQAYLYCSPLKDVSRLLGASIDVEAQTDHLEELLNLYYDVFLTTLRRMNCDTSLFTRESFDREVKTQAMSEFPLCLLSHKFFVDQTFDENKSNEEIMANVINAQPSDAFVDRSMWLAQVYERMKWFEQLK